MIVFSTRIPLKKDVTVAACVELFKEWILKSPHYSSLDISDLSADNLDEYSKSLSGISFNGAHYADEDLDISAIQFRQVEEDDTWCTECLVIEKNGKKNLLVQLDYLSGGHQLDTPIPHKPYIIKLFISSGLCDMDAAFPVNDRFILSDFEYFPQCVAAINGESNSILPVVYLSCDHFDRTVLNPSSLAKKLSGVAHIVAEKNHVTAFRLKEQTDGRNVYGGYVGVYYPYTTEFERFHLNNYKNRSEMFDAVCDSIRLSLVYRAEYSEYSWNQVLLLKGRQKMKSLQTSNQEFDELLELADTEAKALKARIEKLDEKLRKKQATIDQLQDARMKQSKNEQAFYQKGKEPEFYEGEYNDLLHHYLSNILKQKDPQSRGYLLIKSLLDQNPKDGTTDEKLGRIRDLLANNDRLTSTMRSELKDLGFTITENGKHIKLVFHDPKYTFSMSRTPSDHRAAQNMASDVLKVVDYKK